MKAMMIKKISDLKEETAPLVRVDLPLPVAAQNEVRIKVSACGTASDWDLPVSGLRRIWSSKWKKR